MNSKKKLKSWIGTARLETIPLSISGIIIGSFYSFFSQKFDIIIFKAKTKNSFETILCFPPA